MTKRQGTEKNRSWVLDCYGYRAWGKNCKNHATTRKMLVVSGHKTDVKKDFFTNFEEPKSNIDQLKTF